MLNHTIILITISSTSVEPFFVPWFFQWPIPHSGHQLLARSVVQWHSSAWPCGSTRRWRLGPKPIEAEKLSDEDFFQEKVGFIFGISWNILYAEIICIYIYIYILIYIYIYVYTCTYTYIYNQNSLWWNLGKKHGTSPALNLGSYAIVTYPDSSMQMELFLVACPDELMECLHCSPQLWSDRVVLHRSWVQWIFKLNHDT